MIIWLLVAILAAIGEVVTTGLFLATVAAAAVVAAIASLVIHALVIQLALFAVLSLVGILLVRPILVRLLGIDSLSHAAGTSTQAHIVGRRATVTRTVDAHGGQIRIGQSEFWSARSYDANQRILPGKSVEIVLVDGITALVDPVPAALSHEPLASIESTEGV